MGKKKIEAKSAKATISKEQDGLVEETDELVGDTEMFDTPPCNVGYSVGLTLPVPGTYGNVKYNVMLNIPCAHEEIDETFEFAEDWVDKRATALKEEFEDQFEEED